MAINFQRITIVGLGLIGGSWARALKRAGVPARRIGCDRPEVLKRALDAGGIDEGSPDLRSAVQNSDLVILAAPVGVILEQLPLLKAVVLPNALITDTGSTKSRICAKAREVFGQNPLFLGGHPLAGKERSGFEQAEANLFEGARYVISPLSDEQLGDERVKAFASLLKNLGARPFVADADTHDRAAAYLSHLPQLIASGLAGMILKRAGNESVPLEIAASGFREMTRLAESPYDLWKDICLTNREHIESAVKAMIEALELIRAHMDGPELEQVFSEAQKLRRRLDESES